MSASKSPSHESEAVDLSMPDAALSRPAHPIALSVFLATLFALATLVVTTRRDATVRLDVPKLPPPATTPVVSREIARARFFDESVQPEIAITDSLNRQAADRCVARLHQLFESYRDGLPLFVEDLTSISTRLGIVRRMPANWWKNDGRVEKYIQDKFEDHLFSEEQLRADVAAVLDQFKQEIEANQHRMLTQVQASLASADLPEVTVDHYEPFLDGVAEQMRDYSTIQGKGSVYNALTVLVVSEAGGYAATTLVAGLLTRIGSATLVSAATGVGTTATAGAGGAGGGSVVGPVGTVVGLGVGLAVGLVIDWWMTEKFEAEMSDQMDGYLHSVEQTLLTGQPDPSSASTEDSNAGIAAGIAGALPQVCDGLTVAYRERFYTRIVQASPPDTKTNQTESGIVP